MLDCEEIGRTLLRNAVKYFFKARRRNVTENLDLSTLITFLHSGIFLLLITSVSSVYVTQIQTKTLEGIRVF
jgi:hypothetical protein